MKSCPQCHGTYAVAEGFCPMDGTRLRTVQPVRGGPPSPEDEFATSLVGRVLDRRYRLDEIIGAGGMGVVYRATHVLIGKSLAVKVLRREHLETPDVGRRFLLEARVASSLKHPNVVDINDFGELPEGGAYYAMELLAGRTLANRIDEAGPIKPAEAVAIALQICHGLTAAHGQGIVHRDLKPDNVFLVEPRVGEETLVKLLDFGIARAGPRRITAMGAVLGTPEYMAPEQARGEDVDHRVDLYAVGVILFEMLTGRVPFDERDLAKLFEQQLHAAPPHLSERKPDLVDLVRTDEVIQQLLSKSREDRPASAEHAVTALLGAMSQDLGRAMAERLQRSTLAIGSGLLDKPDVTQPAGPSQPTGWKATLPAPGERPAARRPDPGLLLSGPVPTLPHAGGGGRSPRGQPPSAARTIAIAAAAALIAASVTFAAAQWLRDRPHGDDPIVPATMTSTSSAPHVEPSATVSARPESSGPVMPVTPGPTATRVTSNDAAPPPSENGTTNGEAEKPEGAVGRSVTKEPGKKRTRADGAATPAAPKPPPPTPTPSSESRGDERSADTPDPARRGTSKKGHVPADLKDPFPPN